MDGDPVSSRKARVPAARAGPGRRRAGPRRLLALSWVATFTLIDTSVVGLALPDIAQDLDRTVSEVAWVSVGFLLALAGSLLAAGSLTDRIGARRMMLAGAVGFLVTTMAGGAAPTFELLVAARLAQGVAGGVLYTVSLGIVTIAYPPERRARAMSIYFTAGAFAAVVGPVIGGFLTDLGGWRLVFYAQAPIPVVIWVLAFWLLPRSEPGPRGRFDLPGVLAAGVFVLASTYALLQIPVPGASGSALVGGLVAAAALTAFLTIEHRTQSPAVRLSIFRNRRFMTGGVAGAAAWFAIMSGIVYPAIYLQLGRGFDASEAGLLLLAAPVPALVLFPVVGRVVERLGETPAMLLGLGLLVGSTAVMVTWGRDTAPWTIAVTLVLSGVGIGLTLVASATEALSQFSQAESGVGSALFNSVRQLGAALGVALPAVAFELVAAGNRSEEAALGGSTASFWLRLVVLCVPLLLVFALWRTSAVARNSGRT